MSQLTKKEIKVMFKDADKDSELQRIRGIMILLIIIIHVPLLFYGAFQLVESSREKAINTVLNIN